MALFHDSAIVGASGNQGGTGGYQISRSLRFNSADSAYLSRTPASAGNRKTWTWSGWVKRSALSKTSAENQALLTAWTAGSATGFFQFYFHNGDDATYPAKLTAGTGAATLLTTSQTFRDVAGWYHIVLSVDTTQATAADRMKIYVNGVQVTQFQINDVSANVSQNSDLGVNAAGIHVIGARTTDGSSFIWHQDGYLADIHFIDGQALTPSSFAETNATTGQWVPKAYTGSYGTNGFRLDFSDNSAATATTLGKDYSGNSNNWTPNNLSVTAGAGNDSLVDIPVSSGTDTGLGGQVTGNYCTWNPLDSAVGNTFSNGNLDLVTSSSTYGTVRGAIAVSSGKWYWEATKTAGTAEVAIGIIKSSASLPSYVYATADGYSYNGNWNGNKGNAGTTSAYGANYNNNDVIGVALDLDAGTLTFYKNGVSQGVAFTGLSGSFSPAVSDVSIGNTATLVTNFGQRPFAYTAPSGFKALCDTNLPAPVVAKPNSVFDVALWTGNGSARSITGLNFNPDFVWIKGRSGATDHALYDAVRGATIDLVSNSTAAETTQTQGLTAFNSDGFSLGTLAKVNTNTATYAGWAWDAGTSTVTNTSGSISSQVRANASAGFSIVAWTPASRATVGHGLNVAPEFIITKDRDTTNGWLTYHKSLGEQKYLSLNLTSAVTSSSTIFSTAPTSTVFDPGIGVTSGNGYGRQICYCFAPVAGYSAFGSYTGNGSADGPFVYTGFRPRFILIKRTDASGNWLVLDAARLGYNARNNELQANLSAAEGTYNYCDILSNGFKLRGNDASGNASGSTYVWAAFAESPFQYARAR